MKQKTEKLQPKLIFEGARKIHTAIQTIPRTDLEKKRSIRNSGIIKVYTTNARSREEIKQNSEQRRNFLQSQAKKIGQVRSLNKILNHITHKMESWLDVQGNAD
jgi:hypothetical protein